MNTDSEPMFVEMSPDNSQMITFTDNDTGQSTEWIIGKGTLAIGHAVFSYAIAHHKRVYQFSYAVRPLVENKEEL